MNIDTLHKLLESFEEDRRYNKAAAMPATNAPQQKRFAQRAKVVASIIADIRGEILAREKAAHRTPEEARQFDAHLHRVLTAYAARLDKDVRHPAEARGSREPSGAEFGDGQPAQGSL